MFGREPRIPVDRLIDIPSGIKYRPTDQYVAQHRQRLLLAHLNAYQRIKVLKQKQAQAEKHKQVLEKLEFGDIVRKRFQSSGRKNWQTSGTQKSLSW